MIQRRGVQFVIRMGGVYATSMQEKAILLQEHSALKLLATFCGGCCFRYRPKVRRGKGSRLIGGPGSWYSDGQSAHSSRKPRAGTPLPDGTNYALRLPNEAQKGGRGPFRKGGPARRGGRGPRLVVFFGLYGVKKRGNTTSRVPSTSRDPSHFPKKVFSPKVFRAFRRRTNVQQLTCTTNVQHRFVQFCLLFFSSLLFSLS